MAGLARRRLLTVCFQSKRPDLYIRGENKAHLMIILYLILYLTTMNNHSLFKRFEIQQIENRSNSVKLRETIVLHGIKDKFPNCYMQNEIDLAFCKWLKWSRVELVRKAAKLCSLNIRARICNNTLHGSHAKLSRCNQTLAGICVSNLAYKWSILTSLRISGTIEGTRRRFQPAKWQKNCLKTTTNKTDTNLHSAAYLMKLLTFTSPADRFAPDLISQEANFKKVIF